MDELLLLLDENLSPETVTALQTAGYHAASLTAYVPLGSSDLEIAYAASEAAAVIITQDLDFGELCFNAGVVGSGVIVLRLRVQTVENVTERLMAFLRDARQLRLDLNQSFCVVEETRFRSRRRPV